jgi:hypothetical protein
VEDLEGTKGKNQKTQPNYDQGDKKTTPQTYFNPRSKKYWQKNEAVSHIRNKGQLTQLNTEPPKLKAFIKIHKLHNPIRPVVSYRQAPAYKVALFLAKFLKEILALPNTYNVKNSLTLIE